LDVKTGQIRAIYVHPDHALKGVGSKLLRSLRRQAFKEDLPQLIVKATLNAVAFFRAHGFTDVGPDTIELADGTCLPCVLMELQVYQPLEFTADQSIADRVLISLRCDDWHSRTKALQGLKKEAPEAVLDAIVAYLEHPVEEVRQRAGKELPHFSTLREEPVNVGQKLNEVTAYLEHGEDSRVRLCCAIVLLPVRSAVVDRAFFEALKDPEEEIVELACIEVGLRCGPEGTAALQKLLYHDSWKIRLNACIALIQQKTADQRVVVALEAMCKEPEAAEHEAFGEQFRDFNQDFGLVSGAAEVELAKWGTMASILEQARQVAQRIEGEGIG